VRVVEGAPAGYASPVRRTVLGLAVFVLYGVGATTTAGLASRDRPVPTLRSHGETIRAGFVGRCTPRGGEPCAIPAEFVGTEPLPVHAGGLVRLNTDHPASRVQMYLCGAWRPVERRSSRRWVVRLPRKLARRKRCEYNDIDIDFRRGPWAGQSAAYTFNGWRHTHRPDNAGRLVVKERVVNKFGIYEEGAISYLKVRRASDGNLVVRRRYQGTRIRLDQLLPARRYKLTSYVRPCEGDCQQLEPPTDRCSADLRVPPGGEVFARIVTNDGSSCRITFPGK